MYDSKRCRPSVLLFFATVLNVSQNKAPILNSGASTTFATSDDYLTSPRKHKTPTKTFNGTSSCTHSNGKLKLSNTSTPIYLPTLSSSDFNQILIYVCQLAFKYNVLFTKKGCHLLDPSKAPLNAQTIGVRGQNNLYRMEENIIKDIQELAVPEIAQVGKPDNTP